MNMTLYEVIFLFIVAVLIFFTFLNFQYYKCSQNSESFVDKENEILMSVLSAGFSKKSKFPKSCKMSTVSPTTAVIEETSSPSNPIHDPDMRAIPLQRNVQAIEQQINKTNQMKKNVLKQFRIFCINLYKTSIGKKRWAKMKTTIFGPYVEQYPGIYGKEYDYSIELNNNIINKQWDYGLWKHKQSSMIDMSEGEIGVSLSHYYLWKKIVDENISKAFILEDDSTDISPTFESELDTIIKNTPQDYDIILLAFWLHQGNDSIRINEYVSRAYTFVFMNAYIISKQGAEKLLNMTPIDMPIDSWVASKSKQLKIYHHHIQSKGLRPRGIIIQQGAKEEYGSYIDHTNNW